MKTGGLLAITSSTLLIALIAAGQLGLLSGTAPQGLGVKDGHLSPPSKTPNSVSSQASLFADHPQKAYANIAPLSFKGDGELAMQKLAELLRKQERTIVTVSRPDYIYVQSSTAVFKFTDDVEFWLDSQNHVIQVRSASRLGRKDFGVNRARVEAIRAQFTF